MTTDPNVADPVKLAAIKDALHRSGIQAKTAVSVEVSTKPYEMVFDRIASGPREPALELEANSLDELTDKPVAESADDAIVGEIDDDEIEDYPPRFQRDSESESDDVIDVEIMSDGPGLITPDEDDSSLSVELSGPLGVSGPVGSGLMSLQDANEAVAEMRARAAAQAARTRDLRRR